MVKIKYNKQAFISYWKRKYSYFFLSCLIIWYFFTPANENFINLHILPLDIVWRDTFGGFSELGLFKFVIFNLIFTIGIYAISVTLFIIVTGADFWEDGEFERAAFVWLIGAKDKSEPLVFKTFWTRREMFKERRKEKEMRKREIIFTISIIYVPIVSENTLNLLRYLF